MILSEPGLNPTGSSWAVLRTQLIPARGRKLLTQEQKTALNQDTTYPREGTETLLDKLPSEGTTTQLIPARGRKL